MFFSNQFHAPPSVSSNFIVNPKLHSQHKLLKSHFFSQEADYIVRKKCLKICISINFSIHATRESVQHVLLTSKDSPFPVLCGLSCKSSQAPFQYCWKEEQCPPSVFTSLACHSGHHADTLTLWPSVLLHCFYFLSHIAP